MSSDDQRISTEQLLTLAQPVHVDTLTRWEGDPYAGDVGQRALQSETFGQIGLILTYGTEVLYGSDLVEAQKHQPDDDGMVPVVDLAAAGFARGKAEAAVLGLWANHRDSTVDAVVLAEVMASIIQDDEAMAMAVGFDGDDLDALIEEIEREGLDGVPGEIEDEPEVIPELPTVDPTTEPGDIWLLGPHRILCGDCRNPEHVEQLLDGATINLAFTSPPYADRRKYDETSGFKPIPPDEYVEWFEPVQANVRDHLADDGSWFVNIKEHCHDGQRELYVKDLTVAHVRDWGWAFIDEFCWRRSGVPGKWPNRFKNSWEPVFHFARSTQIKMRHDNVTHESDDVFDYSADNPTTPTGFISGNHVSRDGLALPGNVVDVGNAGAGRSGEHAAEFPVALPDFFVRACTDEGDTVFDPFMGSGSTLLAADQNDRVGYGMELSPAYCDVIAARYERATGNKPIRAATGEPVSFMDGDD